MTRRGTCIAVFAAISLTSGCQQPGKTQQTDASPSQSNTALIVPTLPVVEPLLDREALLLAAARAGSAATLGQSDAEDQRKLDGKRFELRMRFGCGDPQDHPDDPRIWTLDEKRNVLTVRVKPELSDDLPIIKSFDGDTYEAVEGFWIRRPWLLTAACPAPPPQDEADTSASASEAAKKASSAKGNKDAPKSKPTAEPSPAALAVPHIGIAQFFTASDPRTHRRDNRAYETTRALKDGEKPSADGYNLVISGRLRRLADGRVIACRSESASAPPDCILSAQFDNVSIELPNGEVIAKWSSA